jgi:Fe-S-cluster containining protein
MIQTDTVQQNAEKTAIDIFNTGSPNKETALYIAEQLHQYGDRLTAEAEREQNLTGKIECNVGCCYCCYSTVYISPVEAILIGHFVTENYSLKKIDALIKRAMNNIRLTSGKTREERIVVWEKTPCIFLENEKCSIYSVRPFTCRA